MDFAIEVKNLSFSFGEKNILNNVNLEVNIGDYVGMIGPNGSGKSTLVKLLLGIYKKDTGVIKVLGKPVEEIQREGSIGYISQKANSFNVDFPATVYEVVGAALNRRLNMFQGYNDEERKKIDNALEIVGLKKHRDDLIGRLSGGQQQRVFIARALVSNPKILFLDEPMVGIDQVSENAVYCLLAELNRNMNITIMMVTHDIGAITVHANKIACMGNGTLKLHNIGETSIEDEMSNLYGYGVNIHAHEHTCKNCRFKNFDKRR
ncbi:MAG: ABC transporter ATP-binding protein [Clostridiales bacterium]|nr:ABC transporter ATP-binding protein [Clostridiales bacterium]